MTSYHFQFYYRVDQSASSWEINLTWSNSDIYTPTTPFKCNLTNLELFKFKDYKNNFPLQIHPIYLHIKCLNVDILFSKIVISIKCHNAHAQLHNWVAGISLTSSHFSCISTITATHLGRMYIKNICFITKQ